MRYGSLEYAYAEPFAAALATDESFRSWVLSRTKFAPLADSSRLLSEEMKVVIPHQDAATVLLCNRSKLDEYAPHIAKFGAVITFEEIAGRFPTATSVDALPLD